MSDGTRPKLPKWPRLALVLLGLVVVIAIIMSPLLGALFFYFTHPI